MGSRKHCVRERETGQLRAEPMHDQSGKSGPRPASSEAVGAKAELAKGDDASDLKAGLAKLALEAPPERLHAGARLRNYFLTGLVVTGPGR